LQGDVSAMLGMRVYLDVITRRFPDAFQAFENEGANSGPGQQLAGRAALHLLAGQVEAARSAADEALPLLEARLKESPDDTSAMTKLSWVYLALGRNSDALRIARQAADLISVQRDAVSGPFFQAGLAQIEARVGAPEEAVKRLKNLLSIPAGQRVSIARLKIDPVWDPIRDRPDSSSCWLERSRSDRRNRLEAMSRRYRASAPLARTTDAVALECTSLEGAVWHKIAG
jgi:tetratricopeptide (TPR) repeat protein